MRNAQVAEWILSLVTSPERAASTIGDLMEAVARRGALWFWVGVLRTAVSMLWRDFSSDPARMMGLAVRAFLVQIGTFLAIIFFSVVCMGVLGVLAGLFWHPTSAVDGPHPAATVVGSVLGVIVAVFVPFRVGGWMAWRSPGRELAPVVAFTILSFVVFNGIEIFWGETQSNLSQFILGLAASLTMNILLQIPMFAGAVYVRRKRMTS